MNDKKVTRVLMVCMGNTSDSRNAIWWSSGCQGAPVHRELWGGLRELDCKDV
jgi:hypothetical protein